MRSAPHPVTLRQLQYVVAVADALSFRKAAAACHVSQPALSSQVAQAEEQLGARLFERDRRRVLLTPAGEEIVRRARALLVAADDLVDAAARFADPLAGSLRVGILPTIAPYLLPRVARALRRELPRLGIQWIEGRTADLGGQLRDGALDAAIVALEAEIGDVEHARIARDEFVVATSLRHPLARSDKPLAVSALEGEDLLLLAEGHCLRDQALAACGRAELRASSYAATSLATLAQIVAAGDGLTLLPEMAVAAENRARTLHVRRFARPAPGRTIVLCWRRGSPAAPSLARLAGILREAQRRAA